MISNIRYILKGDFERKKDRTSYALIWQARIGSYYFIISIETKRLLTPL